MLNIHELERQWLRYKIRRYVPVAAAALTLIVVVPAALLLWPEKMPETSSVSQTQQAAPAPVSNVAPPVSQPAVSTVQTVSADSAAATIQPGVPETVAAPTSKPVPPTATRKAMAPSLGFMQSMEEDALPYYAEEEPGTPVIEERVPEPVASIRAESVEAFEPVEEAEVPALPRAVEAASPEHTVSITQKEADDLNDIVKRFKTNKSPALSLFLARRYYEMGEYQSAYDYSLKTNELDSDIEESWLIFTKSLVKLGQKEQALKVLNSYIGHSGSITAKTLFQNIESGTFK